MRKITNASRAYRALKTVYSYAELCKRTPVVDRSDVRLCLRDLIADLLHLAESEGFNAYTEHAWGWTHFDSERQEEADQSNSAAGVDQLMLTALKAIVLAWDRREDDYVPGLQAALQLAEDAIDQAEGRVK